MMFQGPWKLNKLMRGENNFFLLAFSNRLTIRTHVGMKPLYRAAKPSLRTVCKIKYFECQARVVHLNSRRTETYLDRTV